MADQFIQLPLPGGSWKPPVANAAALPSTGNSVGDARVTQDNGNIYTWSGSAWVDVAAGPDGGVTSVGAFSGSAQTNGASIAGSIITFGPASATVPGMVSTGTQSWAGDKTFTGNLIVNPGPLKVGTATNISSALEGISNLYTASALTINANARALNSRLLYISNVGLSSSGRLEGLHGDVDRRITANTTDANSLNGVAAITNLDLGTAHTYTNSSGMNDFRSAGLNVSGTGTIASAWRGVLFNTDGGVATTGAKEYLLFGSLSGGAKNAYISDNEAYTGNFGLNLTTSNPSMLTGNLGIGAVANPNQANELKLQVFGSYGVGANADAVAAGSQSTNVILGAATKDSGISEQVLLVGSSDSSGNLAFIVTMNDDPVDANKSVTLDAALLGFSNVPLNINTAGVAALVSVGNFAITSLLKATDTSASADFNNRILYAADGGTKIIDWSNTLSGASTIEFGGNHARFTNPIIDGSAQGSIYTDLRQLLASDGTSVMLDWSSGPYIPQLNISSDGTSSGTPYLATSFAGATFDMRVPDADDGRNFVMRAGSATVTGNSGGEWQLLGGDGVDGMGSPVLGAKILVGAGQGTGDGASLSIYLGAPTTAAPGVFTLANMPLATPAANVATFTNSPVAGNPAAYLQIVVNGVTYAIPLLGPL